MGRLGPLRTGILMFALAIPGWGYAGITFHKSEAQALTALALSVIATIIGTTYLRRAKHKEPSKATRIQKRARITIAVLGAGAILWFSLVISLVLTTSAFHPLVAVAYSLVRISVVVIILASPALMVFTLYPLFSKRERMVLAAAIGLLVLTLIGEILATELYATAWTIGLPLTAVAAMTAFLLPLFNAENRPPALDVIGIPIDPSNANHMDPVAADLEDEAPGPTRRL